MSKNYIDYGILIDEAMHFIVKKSLKLASSTKLIGDHHFFISFLTKYPGVQLSSKLKYKYPEEMTIVLQFQFEALTVEEDHFSVVLSFDNIKELIVIPFASITAFADPSVKFGLQFRHISKDNEDNLENIFNEKDNFLNHQQFSDSNKSTKVEHLTTDDKIVNLASFRKNKNLSDD